ncbi:MULTISPECIES: DNA-directed RNA polymerase subunit epsilon [Facklamia]|uniref:DNA-directed RNA polymerase subunit epsilon n=2 Tax=Facklamia hominis TaxID=178214 RepID=K1LFP0_9LACT|nr:MULTISPECIES: DNA-directed RNA polymerase subunit epsilon [Facklamia]EKB53416.1 hypothetical protein HMPREF9706_01674 [Facklamia hominis CCUG 36813]EPH11617.1 hypothetical protein HMPREF9260_00939 [Facklamia hominis ACS-120-V-Sch10]MDK7187891.1 DNA-directed RNA polymerase subunit epsilon [Facklamia hominis]OFL66185.1 hypothetical protein HMPREF2758_07690 [Facklamia sp. HMSC062C11]PKY93232.1 hypothetical protein CYJ56_03550 [Facklamia hominis]
MIFKVIYQETKDQVPQRELSKSLYIEGESRNEVIEKLTQKTPYNVEFIQELDGEHLAYEQEHNPDYQVVEL